jgi:hypothetical protein
MDFLIGILLVIVGILLIVNFTSISISDNKFGSSSNCTAQPNYLISTMQNGQLQGTPSPINATSQMIDSAGRVNYDGHNYEYNKYFFVN